MNLNNQDIKIIFNKKYLKKNFNINNSKINSKEVKKGSIFFAIRGKNTDGHFYIKEVLKKKLILLLLEITLKY